MEEWTQLGFEPTGERLCKDCCVTESLFGGATLPCDWLEIAGNGLSAFLKGTDPGRRQRRKA